MDFGVVGFDGFVCSPSPTTTNNGGGFSLTNAAAAAAAAEGGNSNKPQKWGGGFGFLKQERAMNEAESRDFKLAKMTSPSSNNNGGENNNNNNIPLLQRSNINGSSNNNIRIDQSHHQQMLSFSSPNSHTTTSFPYYHHHHRSAGGMNNGGGIAAMQGGVLSGVRGPFTPSQWMELEHQALIYKYITANVPIPSYLLNPITKAFESAGFSPFSGLRSNALGWGSAFHLGFSNSDPEPGRCRRTDGKKWRCSRDAVADQKYCERHMNRGRHRSRKPVEAQPGNSAPSVSTAAAKLTSASVVGGGGVLPHHHHISGLAPNINNSRNGDTASYPKLSLKDNNSNNAYEETTSLSEFGLVCSDSLLNPLNRSSSLINGGAAAASPDNLNGHDQTTKSSHHPLIRQFMDDSWPKTQLSISIPTDELKTSPPPQRLSGDLEMGLGVGPPNWIPISWGPSMGGPLGEVLHNSATTSECKNNTTTTAAAATKPLNLIDSWDNSPRLASSPTGVLQRGSFVSLSNSSGGSSPRGGGGESSRILDGPGLFNGLFSGPVLTNPSL
ncbi:hypothetical protein ABFX02_14G267500 [Erythranthe guttata]